MKHSNTNCKKRFHKEQSQEIVFKKPSIFRKIISFIIAYNMMFLNIAPVFAQTNITGVQGNNGVYDIDATKISGQTGFRQYENFTLDNGDVANLQFQNAQGSYQRFVNMVDNQVNINGLVNTVKGDAFYNGHAIFVSPNGMVVGASGVLNVGSLTVVTPSDSKYQGLKSAYDGGDLSPYEQGATEYNNLITDSRGNVVVNGKILARKNVELYGKKVEVSGSSENRAGIIAGWNDENTKFENTDEAKNVFNNLVSNNITDTTTFSLENGKVKIVANVNSGFADAAGNIKANVDVKKADIGANEIEISSTAKVDRQERIDLAEAKVNVEDAKITGGTVMITANATQKKDIDGIIDDGEWVVNALIDIFNSDTPSVGSLWGAAGKAEADVTIKDSIINALNYTSSNTDKPNLSVLIHAQATSETIENANFLTPALIDFITKDEASISDFFSSDIYKGFEGAKSSATVTVESSKINANSTNSKNIEISTAASSHLEANNRYLGFILPIGMYGLGTETISKAIVKDNSVLNAAGNIDVTAISSNNNSIVISNNSLLSIKIEDAYIGMILNNTVKTETEAAIISSTVDADSLSVFATNLSENNTDVAMTAIAGTKGQGEGEEVHGNSAVSIVGVLNRSDNKVSAYIQDSENIKTQKDTLVLAQSLNITNNSADATIYDMMVQEPTTFDQRWKDFLKEKQFKYLNINLFDKIKSRTAITATQSATLEVGGVVVWNETKNSTTANIINSVVTAQTGDVKVNANTVDLLSNSATSDTRGEGKYGIALSVIYNIQNNTTSAEISDSVIKANNIDVDATTELPMNQGKLTLGLNFPFKILGVDKIQFGGSFASEANGKWDISPVYPTADDDAPFFEVTGIAEQNVRESYEELKPKVRLSGFFNNMAQSNSIGKNAAVSGSVVYNEVVNNTLAQIVDNSNITINETGNLTVNAVNSVMGYNGLGLFDFLIKKINYKIPGQKDWEYEPTVSGGKFGLGINLAWDNYTNNATAKIDNSSVNATNGNVNVDSASEQSYLNVIMTGARSEAFGIDGSIHVQNISGDTTSQISNITENHKISAKNVSVNSGKAHIKTTAGKVERDEITHLAEWKVQDESAQGDAKYIREAKDEITNIIAQGAWTSQYEEVDNVVQPNSQGVAVGTGVNITNVDRTVKATIDNSKIGADNVFVGADTYNQKIDIEVAAAFSGGVTQAHQNIEPVQQEADNAQDQEDLEDDNIFGNLFDLEDELVENPVGNVLQDVQRQFSMSLAGAVDVTKDSSVVEAAINQSVIDVKDSLTVSANREAKNINFGGGLGQSKKVGAGAAVNYYKQEGSINSYIDESVITFSGDAPILNVLANNKNWILNIAIGAGVANNSAAEDLGFEAALGGSAIANTLKPSIETYINNSTVKEADNKPGKIGATLRATSDIDIINIAGGGSYMHGGSYGFSAGAAFGYNNVKNTISAYVKDSVLDDINELSIVADADNDIVGFAIAAAIIQGLDGTAFAFAGSTEVDYIHDTISSEIIASTVTASDDVEVKANSNSDNLVVAGTLDVTTAQVGGGVSGDIAVNVYRNDITSVIDKDSKILKGNDVKVSAASTEKSNVIPVGASIATNDQYLVAAANIAVNVINNNVNAILSGKIGLGEGVDKVSGVAVSAYDETTIYTRGATLAYSGEFTQANVAGTVNVDVISKEVTALVTDAEIGADEDVSVTAASINSLGGTKNDEGGYDRDDITSPTYVDTLLEKNSDGEYIGLKGGNNFLNWNMFYDISAASKANVAGTIIVKVIENELKAEITKSTIKSKNLSVIANDYSVKNIMAGSIPAFGQAAIGGTVLYTLDQSNVFALITNGSDIVTTAKTDIEAINNKDNIQVVAAAGGSEKASLNISFSRNKNDDVTIAKIDRLKADEKDTTSDAWNATKDVKIKADSLKINAVEDVNATHVTLTGGGATDIAITVNPSINTYNSTVKSGIANANIINSAIDIDAHNNTKTRDILLGLAGAAKGIAGVGVGLRNYYTDNVKAYIEKAVIETTTDTPKDIDLASSSYVNNSNWILSGDGVGEGASLLCNVLLNDLDSEVESSIINSDIKKADNISLTANKDKIDDILNVTGSLSFAGVGGYAEVNVIQTTSHGSANAVIKNTSIEESNSINIEAYNKKDINNTNIGIGGNFEGFAGTMGAIVNDIESRTVAEVDTVEKEILTHNNLNVSAQEDLYLRNKMGVAGVAVIGGSIVGNININNHESPVSAAVKSASNGKIISGSADIKADSLFAMTNSDVAIGTGAGTIPVTVVITDLGTKLNILNDEALEVAGVYNALAAENKLQKEISGQDIDLTGGAAEQGGTFAAVNGNLEANNDINIEAENKIKGYNGDEFSLTNVNVGIQALEAISPVIYVTDIKNLTEAVIGSGTVKSTAGDINLNSKNAFKADYTIVKAKITGTTLFQGNYAYLINHAETNSVVKDAVLEATNVNIEAKTDTQSDISQTFAGVQVSNVVNFSKNENENVEKVSAMVTGDSVDITTTNDLNIFATSNNHIITSLYEAELRAVNIADIMRNYAILSNVSQAIIDATDGEIKVGNDLNIATLSPNGVRAEAYLYDVQAIDLVSFANPIKSEADLSSFFASGIGKLIYDETTKSYSNSVAGVNIDTTGATNIYSGIKSLDNDTAIDSIAFSRFYGMENLSVFNTTTYTDYAFNNMTNYAMLSSDNHKANSVNIKSVSNKVAKTQPTETDPVTIFNFGSIDVQTKVTGKNIINISGKNDIATQNDVELTDTSTAESVYKGVSVDVLGGSDSGFEASVESDSSINISGDYIANGTTITSDVNRITKSDTSFTEISIFGDGKTVKAHNLSKGSSFINIDGLVATKDSIRDNSISVVSDAINNNIITTKIFDLGLIFTGSGNYSESAFDTSNTINIKNTNIDVSGDITISSSNQNIADSNLDTQGTVGLLAIWNDASSENILNASDYINFENSNITAKNIDIQTSTYAGTKKDKEVEALVHSVVGVVLVSDLDVKNTVSENSEIDLKNTNLTAYKDINITTDTGSYINQKAETKAEVGILSFATNTNKVNITNNNKLTLDANSKIVASDTTNISMDTSNEVNVHSYSDATNIGGNSKANAEIRLTSNKTIENNGSIEAGDLVNIMFDKTSDNSLKQHAEAYAYGVGTTSDADGGVWYNLNNYLNVVLGADITSGKNVIIDYNVGELSTRTDNYSETDFLWFIPVTDHAVNEDIHINKGLQKMTLNGIVKAGQGSQRYLKINRDGTIGEAIGFYAGDYDVVDVTIISGDEIKEQLLNKYYNEKTRLEGIYTKDKNKYDSYVAERDSDTAKVDEISDAIEPWEDAGLTNERGLMSELAHILPNEYDSIMEGMTEYSSVASYFKSEIYSASGLNFTDEQKVALAKDSSTQEYKDAYDALSQQQQIEFRSSYRTFTNSLTFDDYIDSRIDLDPVEKMLLKNAYSTLNSHKHYVEILGKPKALLVYENDDVKLIISNTVGTDPLAPYKDQIDDINSEIAELDADITSLNSILHVLEGEIENYIIKIAQTEAKTFPDEEVKKAAYYFKNIDTVNDSKIEVKGIANLDIDGTGNFIASSAGLKIDNYSSYDLIFKDIDMDAFGNSLYIDNKDYTSYLDKPESVNKNGGETDGVHYKSAKEASLEETITGITINNFYDNNHPFAATFDIPNPLSVSNILSNGILRSNASLDIWNESGFIELKSSDYNVPNNVNLLSTNKSVFVDIGSDNSSPTKFTLNSDNLIFAAAGVTIKADEVDIKGDIKSGYTDRKITITDEMLNNLIYDATSDETNLINLGGSSISPYLNEATEYGNLKAIYKGGKIYLYNIPDQGVGSSIIITKSDHTPASGSITGKLVVADGYRNIDIKNNTTNDMVVKDINNVKIVGTISAENIETDADTKTIISKEAASTAIVSGGHLTLDGVINNNAVRGYSFNEVSYIPDDTDGVLSISTTGSANVKISQQVKSEKTVDSILAGGNIDIITEKGGIDISGNITSKYGDILVKTTDAAGGHTVIAAAITNVLGDISVSSKGVSTTAVAPITAKEGNITITNNAQADTSLLGTVTSKKGNILIDHTIGGDIKIENDITADNGSITINNINTAGKMTIAGAVTGNGGDIDITQENAGSLTIGAKIHEVSGGNITISSTSSGDVTINKIGDELTSPPTIVNDNGNIAISNINTTGKMTIAGAVTGNGGNIDITQENAGSLTIGAKIQETNGGNIAIKNTNSGDVTINKIGDDTMLNPTIVNDKGSIAITNTGTSDIYQFGGLKANGSIDVTNTEGSIYQYSSVISGGDINYVNTTGEFIIKSTSSWGTSHGNIRLENWAGDLIVEENAWIVNLSEPETDTTYGIVLANVLGHSAEGMVLNGYILNTGGGNIDIISQGSEGAVIGGIIENTVMGNIGSGKINITNYTDALEFTGALIANKGNISISNMSDGKVDIKTTASINAEKGNIEISNIGAGGMDVHGLVVADKGNIEISNKNSDLRIGEYASDNDNYINAVVGNVVINQTGGNVLNSITDPANTTHSNYDSGNSNHAYKTLIATGGDLVLNVTDGSIGSSNSSNPGFSINAATRDYTDSINVNVSGSVMAKAVNNSCSAKQLINLRAKESDLNIKELEANGNIMLTAADWKQNDTRPTPEDENYFKGYSIFNASDDDSPIIKGQNISLIASDKVGTDSKYVVYEQDTLNAPNSSVSIEAENDLFITGKANSSDPTKVYQMISKHGDINYDMETDADIAEITAGGGLKLTQKAQNLTIRKLGASSEGLNFDDILYPHDNLSPSGSDISPKYAIIKVLDAMDTPERADSNLKIYSAYVKGNNGDNSQYYPDGGRLADYTLVADNIYANSYKAPSSNIPTKAYPEGYKQTQTTWTEADFGGSDTLIHEAEGLNVLGSGGEVSVDVLGVNRDEVNALVPNAQRDNYALLEHDDFKIIPVFRNENDRLAFYGYDFKAGDVVLSINDYADQNRPISIDTLYANNAYINTAAQNLKVEDGIISNYAEFRNGLGYNVIVDNDYHRLVPATVQLYTALTGSFRLSMSNLIKTYTSAPVVHYQWDKLVNTYDSENSFVRLGLKETEIRQKNKGLYANNIAYIMPLISENNYDVWNDRNLYSNVKILEISRTKAVIVNRYDWLVGEEHELELAFDDINTKVKCIVTKTDDREATVKFIDMPESVANKLTYHYMKSAAR